MNWISDTQKAVNFIESNLLENINADDVANYIHSSTDYFQRIFNIVTGFSISEYVRNRRLTLAGEELGNTQAKIIDISLKYGYDSPESFTKAFTRFHGITPNNARLQSHRLKNFRPLTISLTIQGGFDMSINHEIFKLAQYLSCETDNKINGVEVPFLFKKEIIHLPKSLLVGKKVTYSIEKQAKGENPPLSQLWDECGKDGTYDWLEAQKEYLVLDGLLGLYYDINVNDSGIFSYLVGSLMKSDVSIPCGYASYEILESDIALCWFQYNKDVNIWSEIDPNGITADYMKEQGYEGFPGDGSKYGWCSELYPFDKKPEEVLGYVIACKKQDN